jgi:TIR domain
VSTPDGQLKDFFVSYSAPDRQWAEWIAWQLEENDYTVTLQAWDFSPGGNFVADIDHALARTRRTIGVLSPAYFDSDWCTREWTAVVRGDPSGKERKFVPVRVQACDLPSLLGPITYLDLVGRTEEDARNALLTGVRRGRAKPVIQPAYPSRAVPGASTQPLFPPTQVAADVHTFANIEAPRFTVREADITRGGRGDLLVQNFVGAHGSRLRVFHWDQQLHDLVQIADLQSGTPLGFRATDIDDDGHLELVSTEADFSSGDAYATAPRVEVARRWNGTEFAIVAQDIAPGGIPTSEAAGNPTIVQPPERGS